MDSGGTAIEFPDGMRRTHEARGEAGRAWLASLPGTVESLCAQWTLTPGAAYDGGNGALVLAVTTADGAAAVLKLDVPRPGVTEQIRTLMAADGHGYVRLYAQDERRAATLMEPLGAMLLTDSTSVEEALDISVATLREAWRVPRLDGVTVEPGTDKASELLESLYDMFPGERPCSDRVIEVAHDYAVRRRDAFDLDSCVVCHGDPHPANLLRVPRPRAGAPAGYVFVDPDGFLCHPSYDLGVVIRAWTAQVLAASDPVALVRGYADRLSAATGIDAQAIWEWGYLERVSSGLFLIKSGHHAEGRDFLASAERLIA